MINIKEGQTYQVRDIWSYDITFIKGRYTSDEFVGMTYGTSYLMGKNSSISIQDGLSVFGKDFAGQTGNKFTVYDDSTFAHIKFYGLSMNCLLYTSPSPRDS